MQEDSQQGGADQPLAKLREKIAEVDRSLLELIRRRMELAGDVGRLKASAKRPIVVQKAGDRVLTRARQHAEACGISEDVMESIFDAVMRGSIERQHRVGIELRAAGGHRLLILGGAGNMGEWFHRFSGLLGHSSEIVDPAMAPLPHQPGRFATLQQIDDLDVYDAILVSVPLGKMNDALAAVIARRPRGLVIEIASIKDHLEPSFAAATEQGVELASLHPMFGPGKSPYEPLTFVLACRQDPLLERQRIERWLQHPYTHLVPVPFDHHDRLMGWLLGLGHLSGMLFGCALTRSGLGAELLATCASTTYNRQASTALSVLLEDPDLYFDIQSLNPHRGEVYEATRDALSELVDAVQGGAREDFREALGAARRFLSNPR